MEINAPHRFVSFLSILLHNVTNLLHHYASVSVGKTSSIRLKTYTPSVGDLSHIIHRGVFLLNEIAQFHRHGVKTCQLCQIVMLSYWLLVKISFQDLLTVRTFTIAICRVMAFYHTSYFSQFVQVKCHSRLVSYLCLVLWG